MNIKKTANLLLNFAIKRLAEIFGLIIFAAGIILLMALLTYSPDDPNFIFQDNTDIKNLLGFKGSFMADLFFQSIGLIAYLIPFTLILTGVNIFITKEFFLIIENMFFVTLYSLSGTFFLTYFYSNSFILYINGNGGFIGNYLNQTLLNSTVQNAENIFYYIILIITLVFFLVSINFNLEKFFISLKKIVNLFLKKNEKNYTDENEIINEYIPQEEIKNLIQEDLPFIKNENKADSRIKFKLPNLDLLKIPTKKEIKKFDKGEINDSKFLEKILMDFGVSGNIKQVSHGPVVTLNEFEPAAGVKVSKIINLSDDIARNTSSESARIATIPGSNTIGIELPNN